MSSAATEYDKAQDARLKKLEDKVFFPTEPPPVTPNCGADPDPNDEHVREGGWGGDMAAPSQWESVQMKDDPNLWKVVDAQGKNIAHKFESEAKADEYIRYHVCISEGGDTDPTPEPPIVTEPQPPKPTEPPTTTTGLTPYPVKGEPMASTQRGPTTRHYASGKPDDKTVEKNVKGIKFDNYQWVTYTTMNSIEHDDNISLKFGGQHMGKKGWYDCGVSFDGTKICLGVEPKHPSTKLCVVKSKKTIGSILDKKIGVAGVFHKKENHIELWVDFPAGTGWKKELEGTAIGGLNPDPSDNEAQLRIDGFEELPTIHAAFVTEI